MFCAKTRGAVCCYYCCCCWKWFPGAAAVPAYCVCFSRMVSVLVSSCWMWKRSISLCGYYYCCCGFGGKSSSRNAVRWVTVEVGVDWNSDAWVVSSGGCGCCWYPGLDNPTMASCLWNSRPRRPGSFETRHHRY